MLVTSQLRPAEQRTMSKTTYKRADRVADQIRMEVADILMRKIKDPRVRSVTVTDVDLTADLRIAHIFVTTMEKDQAERDVFAGLSKASGFVRAELGRRLTLRYLPEIIFKKDVSGPRGDRVLQLLDELHADTDRPEAPASSNIPDTAASGS
jgi:ribosome-binding factor A